QGTFNANSNTQDVVLRAVEYDALGNVSKETVNQVTTETRYDALGRVVDVVSEARMALDNAALTKTGSGDSLTYGGVLNADGTQLSDGALRSPYQRYGYDAYGNQIQQWTSGVGLNDAQRSAWKAGDDFAITVSAKDQTLITEFDALGRKTREVDAAGNETRYRSDAAGNVTDVFRTYQDANKTTTYEAHTEFQYDKLDRQVATITHLGNANQLNIDNQERQQIQAMVYNGYGEMVARGSKLQATSSRADYIASLEEQFSYNAAGQLIASNENDGVLKEYRYNLQGLRVAEYNPANGLTQHAYNKLGQKTLTVLPQFKMEYLGGASALVEGYLTESGFVDEMPQIRTQFDRWGNVLEVRDNAGLETTYRYNALNQLTQEFKKDVEITGENGSVVIDDVSMFYEYDSQGNMVKMMNQRGFVTSREYDAVNQMMHETDGEGHTTHLRYDALGRVIAKQNALGHVTTTEFDALNQVTQLGDITTLDGQKKAQILTRFEYNALGNQTKVYTAHSEDETATDGTQWALKTTEYDTRGNVIKTT
ncbi:hypothetical protein, partial [Pleionea sp. CnH1-48]|uniref:hypothetical protein n=1 Tax=Pleionea sp. CnH1-48 TaxID=2954494 RepID=UPI0020971E07